VRISTPARPQWVEPAGGEEQKSGGEQKSTDVERKMVTLIYPTLAYLYVASLVEKIKF
jgi:hypothetical protein